MLNCFHKSNGQPLVVKVLSVDTIAINGHQRKRYHYLASDFVIDFSGIVIEGIGQIYYMVPVDHNTYNGPLRCYEDRILGLYKNQYYYGNSGWQQDCDLIITSVDEQTASDSLNVFPNPFYNLLSFQIANNKQTSLTLYDIMGNQVLHQIFMNSTTINTETLLGSIYFYNLRTSNGPRKTGKIIKQ